MKTSTSNHIAIRRFALRSILMIAWGLCPVTAAETRGNPGFIEKMDQWQNKMSEKFRDTWKSMREDAKDKSVGTASVDLREDTDNYTLRLNLPGRDLGKVEVSLAGETLRIVAPAGDKANRYEQTVALAGVDPKAEPKVERKTEDDMIVITVRKGSTVAENKPSLTIPDPELLPFSDWDHDIFARMDRMRRDMDRVFENAFSEFRTTPEYKGFFNEARFGSTIDLKEDGTSYIVRAYLPDRSMQNLNVTVEDRMLKIEAKEQTSTTNEGEGATLRNSHKAAYSQLVTLPGPVQTEHMKVEKKEGMLIVTLPKAK